MAWWCHNCFTLHITKNCDCGSVTCSHSQSAYNPSSYLQLVQCLSFPILDGKFCYESSGRKSYFMQFLKLRSCLQNSAYLILRSNSGKQNFVTCCVFRLWDCQAVKQVNGRVQGIHSCFHWYKNHKNHAGIKLKTKWHVFMAQRYS